MPEEKLAALTERVDVLTQLLLSHIVATDIDLPGSAAATIDMAKAQSRAAMKQGRERLALGLDLACKRIADVCASIARND